MIGCDINSHIPFETIFIMILKNGFRVIQLFGVITWQLPILFFQWRDINIERKYIVVQKLFYIHSVYMFPINLHCSKSEPY